MGRSVHSKPYKEFLELMIAARERAGLTQEGLAERIGRTQSFVSKYERGERRLDVVEFAEFVRAMDLDPSAVFAQFLQHAFDDAPG
ncbi:transcriptional regulator (plasmid) [Methylosinus sp. C49]|uniref:helix-turn-helix domain-containing protein n=1 Tax=Methylosinus sp. C49 TaxID=2699395 RepID=UPI001366F7CD|nr:helix-turn-helix transcriptional regulator [Methylosinus sp. C49]BBU64364.1 transcriptional regulator [Methylosinus sp. C49]